MLEKEFQYYIDNQEALVKIYSGKLLIIKDQGVIVAFETFEEAYEEGKKLLELGTFLIQKCSPGEEDYSATFHTQRVSFA